MDTIKKKYNCRIGGCKDMYICSAYRRKFTPRLEYTKKLLWHCEPKEPQKYRKFGNVSEETEKFLNEN